MNLGDFIKGLRQAAGLGHEELAKKAKLHRNTVINVEGGDSVRFDTVRDILNALDLSAADWGKAANLWIRQQIGESDYVRYGVPDAARKLIVAEQADLSDSARVLSQKLAQVDEAVRQDIIKIADRPELVECVRVLNEFYDRVLRKSETRVFEKVDRINPAAAEKKSISYSRRQKKSAPR